MNTRTRGANVTPEILCSVLEALTMSPVLADAMRAFGYSPNTIFAWLSKSRAGDPTFLVRWPLDSGDAIQFADAVVMAQRAHLMHFAGKLKRDVDIGTPRVLRTPQGDVVWEKDPLLLATYGGDNEKAKEFAETVGGVIDYPYLHDSTGARVAATVHDASPAALRIHAARSILPGWNPADRQERDSRIVGRFMIGGAVTQGNKPAALDYARPAKPLTPLQQDLQRQLEHITKHGPAHPVPSHPVHVHGRASGDVTERTTEPGRPDGVQRVTPRTTTR